MSMSSYLSQIQRIEKAFTIGSLDTHASGIVLGALKAHIQVDTKLTPLDREALYKEITRVSLMSKDLGPNTSAA